MSDPITFPPGAPCWVDLFTSDPDRARAFYGELFGWTYEESGPEYGGYVMASSDGDAVGGLMRNDGSQGAPDSWSVHLATADAAATLAAAAAHGGSVMFGPMDVPRLGRSGMLTDVGGAVVGCWQPDPFTGVQALNRPGAPGWFELRTRDYEGSVGFYRDVFGWDAHVLMDSEEMRYTTLGQGDAMRAGIFDATAWLPEGTPAHWAVYFAVEDADGTVARAEALGGAVVSPAMDTPYGRLAGLTDPTGAHFSIAAG
ncbi:MAG: VOC family protein [Thermoleophilia bacterium]|nr:VOC family protein [Thermoleophilia bacterium]